MSGVKDETEKTIIDQPEDSLSDEMMGELRVTFIVEEELADIKVIPVFDGPDEDAMKTRFY